MLDIKLIREKPEFVKAALKKKGVDFDVDALVVFDEKRRKKIQQVDEARAEHNALSAGIAGAVGKEKERKIAASKNLKTALADAEFELKALDEEFLDIMYGIPNLPAEDVPQGKDESENKPIRTWGELPSFSFVPKDHMALGEALDIIDVERAAKVTGSRFNYLKAEAALLEFALVQFVMQALTNAETVRHIADGVERGYQQKPFIPVLPPVMIRPEMFRRMARLTSADKDERYYLQQDDMYLIGSAEHTLGSMHADEIISEEHFPLRYVGFSTSFRREAGSYGKDARGILRVHQFDKIELESFSLPEYSLKEHYFFIAVQEYIMQLLMLPYRVVLICTGDMGRPNARQVDIEAWMPGQNMYRETHTADYMTDYQARRLNTKVKRSNGAVEVVHTNDATAVAIGRTLIAILENYQQEDGSVRIPDAVKPFMGGITEIRRT